MGKRILCIVALALAVIFQSSAVSFAEGNAVPEEKSNEAAVQDIVKEQQNQLNEEEIRSQLNQLSKYQEQLKGDQEQLKIHQEQLKKDQEQLKIHQEQLKKDQEQLKKDQEQLKKGQKQLEKEREKLEGQDKRKVLSTELTGNTYLKYIKELGYYKATSKDEKLNTRNATLLFQSDHNMSLSGVWDNATKEMLINRLVSSEFSYADKITGVPTNGKWIAVNKTKRILTLYDGRKVLKKYPVAVGNPHTLTKSGKFTINNKIIDPDWGGGGFGDPVKGGIPENPLGSRWLGINRSDGSYGIHGTNSFYSIGRFISHGCIRMQNYCIEELFPLVPMKAPVWVGTESELKTWGITQDAFSAH